MYHRHNFWLSLLVLLSVAGGAWGQSLDRRGIGLASPYNGYGQNAFGTACTSDTLAAAISGLGSDPYMLYLSRVDGTPNRVPCAWVLTGNLTIPRNVHLWIPQGSTVTLGGFTLTLNGPHTAEEPDWYTGAGSLVFGYVPWDSTPAFATYLTGYVATGCLHPTSLSTTASMPACIVRTNDGRHMSFSATSLTYGAGDGAYLLVAYKDTTSTVSGCGAGNWTRHGVTPYLSCKYTTRPRIPAGGVALMEITLTTNAIAWVGDIRPESPLGGPVNLLAPMFGAVGDCTPAGVGTNDTAALQAAINNAANRRREVHFPAAPNGEGYCFTRLFFQYHATDNPGFPFEDQKQGRVTVQGDGEATLQDVQQHDAKTQGTLLVSTDATGPALYMTKKVGSALNSMRTRLRDMTVVATNTTWVLHVDATNNNIEFERLCLVQKGTSSLGGAYFHDVFAFVWNTGCSFGPDPNVLSIVTHSPKVGIRYDHSNSGGLHQFSQVTSRNWGTCWQLGGADPTDGNVNESTAGINVTMSQAKNCEVGLVFGAGLRAAKFVSGHIEDVMNKGILIHNNARATSILYSQIGGGNIVGASDDATFPDDADIWIGEDDLGADEAVRRVRNVVIIGNSFVNTQVTGIKREVGSASDGGITIIGNHFDGKNTELGTPTQTVIDLGVGFQHGCTILGNSYEDILAARQVPIAPHCNLQAQPEWSQRAGTLYTYSTYPSHTTTAADTTITPKQGGNTQVIRVNAAETASIHTIALVDETGQTIPEGTELCFTATGAESVLGNFRFLDADDGGAGGNLVLADDADSATMDGNDDACFYLRGGNWIQRGRLLKATFAEACVLASGDPIPSVADTHCRIFRTAGTATITDFSDGRKGQEFLLHCNDTSTIDFSSNVNLIGNRGVDYPCTPGGVLRCLRADVSWYCTTDYFIPAP